MTVNSFLASGGDNFATLGEHRVEVGDRLDNLAARHLGDPQQYWRLLLATPSLRHAAAPTPYPVLPGIARLPPEPRAAVLLHLVAGLTDEAAAPALGLTVPAYQAMIRDSLPAQTLRKAPMPANRKTGATASWMICATVVTEVGAVESIAFLSRERPPAQRRG